MFICNIIDVSSPPELQLSYEEDLIDPPDSPARIQQELDNLRLELEGEREVLQHNICVLVQHNLTLAEFTREQLDLWVGSIQRDSMMFAVFLKGIYILPAACFDYNL